MVWEVITEWNLNCKQQWKRNDNKMKELKSTINLLRMLTSWERVQICYHGGVLFEPERVVVDESGTQLLHGFMKLLRVTLGDAVPVPWESEQCTDTDTHTLLHTDTDTHTLLHTDTDTHTLLHTDTDTHTLLHTDTDTHTLLHTDTETHTLLHRHWHPHPAPHRHWHPHQAPHTLTSTPCSTQTPHLLISCSTQTLKIHTMLHTDTKTHTVLHTNTETNIMLHTDTDTPHHAPHRHWNPHYAPQTLKPIALHTKTL